MTIAYKALAALLDYPTADLVAALPEIAAVLKGERAFDRRLRDALGALLDELAASDLFDAQERYVELFDRGRSTSLHLFEHVHGESRDRGQAMVDLQAVYARAGLKLAAKELPDYLPVMLEFLSTQPQEVGEAMIEDCAHILRGIGEALLRRESPYAAVFGAVLALSAQPGLDPKLPATTTPERPLDEEWIEEPVVFGPAAASPAAPAGETAVIKFMPRGRAPR